MGATDYAKEIIRIGSTAGLSKDIIDMLEIKLALLTGEVEDLGRKNAVLAAKASKLEIENGQLRAQIKPPNEGAMKESMGVLWKRTAEGFEPNPYCTECARHPVMNPLRRAKVWICSAGHIAPMTAKPPAS